MSEAVETEVVENVEDVEFNPTTGEIIVAGDVNTANKIKLNKVKALNLIKPSDFVRIGGNWTPKKGALTKILSSLPISYNWKILEKDIKSEYALVKGELEVNIGDTKRVIEGMGVVEKTELEAKKNYSLHNMLMTAETRAQKRCIDLVFGSVINYFVQNTLEKGK